MVYLLLIAAAAALLVLVLFLRQRQWRARDLAMRRLLDTYGQPYGGRVHVDFVTGVPGGYFLLRRQPRQLFDAISPLARDPKLSPRLLKREIEKYFQSLFDLPERAEMEQELANLTNREREILLCLSKGFSDKQIADALNISVWTVHGHMKNVFEKLGVHSRTEAVIKFLQK